MCYIFPTVFWEDTIDLLDNERKPLIEFHNKLFHNTPGKQQTNSSWQSENEYGNDACFDILKTKLNEKIKKIQEKIFKQHKMFIDQIWFNSHEYNAYNKIHQHGIYGLAGVYYLDVPEGSGDLVFERQMYEAAIIQAIWGNTNSDFEAGFTSCHIKPKNGKLIIFPSWLPHWVDRCKNESERRISISFNVTMTR